jgi:TRAP-type C4-dicarboxylate transport system permease small subunit
VDLILKPWRSVLAGIAWIERLLIVVLIAIIVLSITGQVISRYVFGQPIAWVEEVATYSFIWATFIGASLGLKSDRHVKIDTFVGRLPPRAAAIFKALVFAIILALLIAMLPKVWINVQLEMRRMTVALPVMVPIGWFFSVPLFVGLASMALTAAYRLLEEVSFCLSGRDRQVIQEEYGDDSSSDDEIERAFSGSAT